MTMKPVKKEDMAKDYAGIIENYCDGYNQCWDDRETWLPDEAELTRMITTYHRTPYKLIGVLSTRLGR